MADPIYRRRHQQIRAANLQAAYGTHCWYWQFGLCKFPDGIMRPHHKLHLDHIPGTNQYRGFSHAECNTADGGRRSHDQPRNSRDW